MEHNLRPGSPTSSKYYTQSLSRRIVSIGTIGLIKAVDTFRPDRKIRFSTYASRCVENAILSQQNNRRLRWKTMNLWSKMVYVLPPESPQLCIGCGMLQVR